MMKNNYIVYPKNRRKLCSSFIVHFAMYSMYYNQYVYIENTYLNILRPEPLK